MKPNRIYGGLRDDYGGVAGDGIPVTGTKGSLYIDCLDNDIPDYPGTHGIYLNNWGGSDGVHCMNGGGGYGKLKLHQLSNETGSSMISLEPASIYIDTPRHLFRTTDGVNNRMIIEGTTPEDFNVVIEHKLSVTKINMYTDDTGFVTANSSLVHLAPQDGHFFYTKPNGSATFDTVIDNNFPVADFILNITQYGLRVKGNIVADGTITPSDDRLKHNEEPVFDALNTINKLKLLKYDKTYEMLDADFNGDLTDQKHFKEIGFIAQDVAEIPELSWLVAGGGTRTNVIKDEVLDNETGEIVTPAEYSTVEEPFNLNYQGITNYAIQAIQEIDTKYQFKISSLENTIATLLARVTLLENS